MSEQIFEKLDNNFIPFTTIPQSSIRYKQHNNERYYSIIDIIVQKRKVDFKTARNYYHVFKNRLVKNDHDLFWIKQLKLRATDNKMYKTDCTNAEGVVILNRLLNTYLEKISNRRHKRLDDEVINFHPVVITYFAKRGYQTSQHVSLPSGNIIDIIAKKDNFTAIIECKVHMTKTHLYHAIGQVLCYCSEYEVDAQPIIVYQSSHIDDYIMACCANLDIQIIKLDEVKD